MDSFYEQPRTIKVPHLMDQMFPSPVVPEVSMLIQNSVTEKTSPSGDSMLLTYKAWKERNSDNKNNLPQNMAYINRSDFSRKQVRFESQSQNNPTQIMQAEKNILYEPTKMRSFEQIYLANVPNHQLDVSIIDSIKDVPSKENIENVNPNVNLSQSKTAAFNEVTANNTKSDISKMVEPDDTMKMKNALDFYNHRKENFKTYNLQDKYWNKQFLKNKDEFVSTINKGQQPCACNCKQKQQLSDTLGEDSKVTNVNKQPDEPTVSDLLKIIQQQNEQLIILQKQVGALLNNRDMPKQIEAPQLFEKYQTSTQIERPSIPLKRPMQQFSLDVMTSFEVSIKRQQNLNRPCKDNYYQSKITEVTETSSKTSENSSENVKHATVQNIEPPRLMDSVSRSPENVIDIDMKDYSSDDSSDDEAEDTSNSGSGWTFYNNIMGQVNEIFKKSGIQSFPVSDKTSTSEASQNLFKQTVMKKVKEATVKHLKSIGVHVPAMEMSDDAVGCNSDNNSNPNNISYAVKQLLMKYLPDEQLAKVTLFQEQKIQPQKLLQPGLIKRRPEFSLATLQYMQKYNLLNDDNQNIQPATNVQRPNELPPNFDRILDITAIRQQPKLL